MKGSRNYLLQATADSELEASDYYKLAITTLLVVNREKKTHNLTTQKKNNLLSDYQCMRLVNDKSAVSSCTLRTCRLSWETIVSIVAEMNPVFVGDGGQDSPLASGRSCCNFYYKSLYRQLTFR